jgi:hypothetical protein
MNTFLTVLALTCLSSTAFAQQLDLSLSTAVVTFPGSDPDTVPLVSAAPVQVTYRVRQNNKATWSLTILGAGDLISGPSRIDITNVTWVATPAPPFQNGTLSKTVAQRIASGSGNVNPSTIGSITFRLANSWTYSTGTYTQTVVFTLTAP